MRRIPVLATFIVTMCGMVLPHAGAGAGKLDPKASPLPERALKTLREASARQNEDAIPRPASLPRQKSPQFNALRNLYFGDTHVHSALSFDSFLAGNRLSLQDAYRFAMGERLTLVTGETVRLSQPLDFIVVTDHAESFGLFETCSRDGLTRRQMEFCKAFESPSAELFLRLRSEGVARPPRRSADLCDDDPAACLKDARTTWHQVRAAAEAFNAPGKFTAFAGYEYSPVLPKQGKIHRNVIFRNGNTPDRAVSAFDADTVLDLWRSLERECTGDCEFLTIPHNMNKSWGIAYSGRTIDGDAYEDKDWALRGRHEPLAEIFQIKGSSECGYQLGASDEECNFELAIPLCDKEDQPGCSGPKSFARAGLRTGLELQSSLGFNPLRFGFVGSTDTHNSTPGDTEEYDYRGSSMLHESPAVNRLGQAADTGKPAKFAGAMLRRKNPGGLAAVWARENTRDAIFSAMARRETYATSGTRIRLRFFAGWDFDEQLLNSGDLLQHAYAVGVPMGSVLPELDEPRSPEFLIWAMRDPAAAPLQRVQMVKAWMEGGESRELVRDIACSDRMVPEAASGRCPDNGARVDVASCAISADKGDNEILVRWTDPDFDARQAAVYYVRVLENPSCRWSSFDAIRIGQAPPADVPATIQERAWSSPIWYSP